MNVLALDTSFGAASVAVRYRAPTGEWFIREEYQEGSTGHAEVLMPMVESVMAAARLPFASLDRIAICNGPGSFTGMRIAVAAARGLALATGRPVVATSSLAVIALRAEQLMAAGSGPQRRAGVPLAVCVDARKGEVYAQCFDENAGDPLGPPELARPADVLRHVSANGLFVVGSGAASVASAAVAAGKDFVTAHFENLQPHARQLALMAPALSPTAAVKPLYLRPPDAKPQATLG
jgi:tRNA threonylcarbamoyl adenosine modification protein YeaZ